MLTIANPTSKHLVRVWYTGQSSPLDVVAEPMGFNMKTAYKIQIDARSLSKLEVQHSFLCSKHTVKLQNVHGGPGRLLKPLSADWCRTGTTMVEFDNFAQTSATDWVIEIVQPKLDIDYTAYPRWSILGACQQAECSAATLSHNTDHRIVKSPLREGDVLMLYLYHKV